MSIKERQVKSRQGRFHFQIYLPMEWKRQVKTLSMINSRNELGHTPRDEPQLKFCTGAFYPDPDPDPDPNPGSTKFLTLLSPKWCNTFPLIFHDFSLFFLSSFHHLI